MIPTHDGREYLADSSMPQLSDQDISRLCEAAQAAAAHAYCPFSKFAVGAAALAEDGEIFAGCNIENASYGLTLCAERVAVAAAVAAGRRKIKAMAIYTPTPQPHPPCGACRQFIAEFGPQAEVISTCQGESAILWQLDDLLPSAFRLDCAM
jgi:cytidine deaminase